MKITPILAAGIAALATAPVTAAAAASIPALEPLISGLVIAGVTALVGLIAGAVTKLTGATLDQRARDALQRTLTNAANLAVHYLIARATRSGPGISLDAAVDIMLGYVPKGAPGAVSRFGLDTAAQAPHLRDMAAGRLVEQLGAIAPDLLTTALDRAGAPVGAPGLSRTRPADWDTPARVASIDGPPADFVR